MSSMTWILLFGMAVCIHYNSAIPSKQADSTEPDLTDALLSLDDVPERELREAETGGLNNATVHGNGGQLHQRSVDEDTDEQNDGDDVVDGELQTRSTDDGYPYVDDDDDEDQYFGGYSEDRKRSLDLDDEIDGDDKIDDVDEELQTRSANDGYPYDDDDEDDDDEDQYFGGYSEDRKRSLDDEIHGDDENDGDGELHTRSNDYDDDDDDDDVDDYADFLSSYKFARELDDSVDNTLDKNGSIDTAKRDTEESGLSNHDESDAIDMAQFINKLSRRALPKEAKKVDGLDSLFHTSSGITELHIVEPYDFEINEDNKDTELIMNPENSNNKRQTEHKEQTQENTTVDKSHLFKVTNPLATSHSMVKPDDYLTDHFTNVEMSQSITKRSFTASIPKTTSVPTTIPVPKATSGNMYMRTNSDVDDSNAIKDKTKPATPKPKMIVPHIVIKPLGGKPVGPLAKAEQLNREYGLLFSPYPKVEVAWHEPYLYRNCWITALLSSGNGFPSNCHPGGTYAPKQCYLQRCWCVNKDGSPQETDYKRFHYKIDGAMLECTQNY